MHLIDAIRRVILLLVRLVGEAISRIRSRDFLIAIGCVAIFLVFEVRVGVSVVALALAVAFFHVAIIDVDHDLVKHVVIIAVVDLGGAGASAPPSVFHVLLLALSRE